MPEKKQEPKKQPTIAEILGCRKAYVAKPADGLHDVCQWEWSDKERTYVPVKTGVADFQAEVEQNRGHDIRSILNRQEGDTPLEKLNNAVANGLFSMEGVSAGYDYGDEVADLTILPDNKAQAQMAMKRATNAAEGMNDAFGLKGEDRLSFEDYFKGKAEAIAKQWLEARRQESAQVPAEKGDS